VAGRLLEAGLGAAPLALRLLLRDHLLAVGAARQLADPLDLLLPGTDLDGVLAERADDGSDVRNGRPREVICPHLQLMLVALGCLPVAFHDTLLLPTEGPEGYRIRGSPPAFEPRRGPVGD